MTDQELRADNERRLEAIKALSAQIAKQVYEIKKALGIEMDEEEHMQNETVTNESTIL